jgi:hypothetical protein
MLILVTKQYNGQKQIDPHEEKHGSILPKKMVQSYPSSSFESCSLDPSILLSGPPS